MSSLRSWLRGSSSTTTSLAPPPSSQPNVSPGGVPLNNSNNSFKTAVQKAEQEAADIDDAMAGAGLLMNDDIDGAEARLRMRKDSSTFHLLALGVATFMKSILGFEKEIMTEATNRLSDCEGKAWADIKKAQREADKASGGGYWYGRTGSGSDATADRIYPPGTEFALVYAEAQLMNAVVAVMHESLTEGIRGFYKLRKAFITLEGIMQSEAKALAQLQNGGAVVPPPRRTDDVMPGSFDDAEFDEFEEKTEPESGSDRGFVDASPSVAPAAQTASGVAEASEPSTPAIREALGGTNAPLKSEAGDVLAATGPDTSSSTNASVFKSSRDIFVHSGANMCFGALLLLISMVPPAFSRLLQIVGFKGDRPRGVRMLWKSTQFPNTNGAVAGLILLAYYNGLLAFADILPSDLDVEAEGDSGTEVVGYPRERCAALLADMRVRYPESRLWKLEEARVLANGKRIEEAVAMLSANTDSKMRQITALNTFELALNSMFSMNWPVMKNKLLRCVELNDWSHAFYMYLIGSAELELYRDAYHRAAALVGDGEEDGGDDKAASLEAARLEAAKHKKSAEKYFREAPSLAGRKRFLSRQMPFEVFVGRKLQKWEERAAALGVDLADAIGSSPAMEMTYLWNGSKRMSAPLLERARKLVTWERCTAGPDQTARIREEVDEAAIRAVVDAALLRSLGRGADAKEVLAETLKLDSTAFKGPTKDDYALPAAHYEVAAVAWVEACDPRNWPEGGSPEEIDAHRQQRVAQCEEYLERVAGWESFVLDARLGMRVQVGLDSVRWLKEKKGWA